MEALSAAPMGVIRERTATAWPLPFCPGIAPTQVLSWEPPGGGWKPLDLSDCQQIHSGWSKLIPYLIRNIHTSTSEFNYNDLENSVPTVKTLHNSVLSRLLLYYETYC